MYYNIDIMVRRLNIWIRIAIELRRAAILDSSFFFRDIEFWVFIFTTTYDYDYMAWLNYPAFYFLFILFCFFPSITYDR
jgi:hypothetical protein